MLCLALGGMPVLGQGASSGGSAEVPTAYGNPEVLVDVDWLAGRVDDPSVRIVDARAARDLPASASHLPGAVFVDVCCPSDIMDAEPFARLMGESGIGNDTTVVVYDALGGLEGARLWWALQYYGHEDARLLDGGIRAWTEAGRPLETDTPEVEPAIFTAEVQPERHVSMNQVRAAIDDPAITIVDALPADGHRSQHIPTAVSLPAPDLLDWTSTVKAADELSTMLEDAGLDPTQRTITSCYGGYWGAFAAFVLYLMGFEDVALYDGSLADWTNDPSNPLEGAWS